MTRLIDADALIENFLDHCRTEFETKNCCMANENVISIIQNAPTVEIRDNFDVGYVQGLEDGQKRPKGKWIMNKTSKRGRNYTCTNCEKISRNKFSFCPNCGADMREDEA